MFNKPTFEFNGNHVKMIEGKKRVKYIYADPSMFVAPPEKDIEFPDPEIQFNLTQSDLDSLLRASAVLHLPEIGVVGNGSKMELLLWMLIIHLLMKLELKLVTDKNLKLFLNMKI